MLLVVVLDDFVMVVVVVFVLLEKIKEGPVNYKPTALFSNVRCPFLSVQLFSKMDFHRTVFDFVSRVKLKCQWTIDQKTKQEMQKSLSSPKSPKITELGTRHKNNCNEWIEGKKEK